jgi:hypothetical protein
MTGPTAAEVPAEPPGTPAGLIRPDLAELVGRPYGRQVSFPVCASDIRRWAIAVYYPDAPPPHYLDPQLAETGRLLAPLDINVFAWGAARSVPTGREIETDQKYMRVGAMEHRLGTRPPDLVRALNAGLSVDYTGVRIHPGDVITSQTIIERYSERHGRLGAMLVTDTATTWANQDGETVKTFRMSLIRY